jgi:Fe-S-cluster containining protein
LSFPAIAFSTYLKNVNHPELGRITKNILKRLKKTAQSIRRARLVHSAVDQEMEQIFSDPAVKKFVRCGKRCSHCCYSHVAITSDEADLLAQKIKEKNIQIDYAKLNIQQAAGDSIELWNKIPHPMRSCVLLDESGSCSLYEDRPSACRVNNVVSDPQYCRLDQGEQPIRLLLTERADMAMVAHFLYTQQSKGLVSGTIPQLLWQSLQQKTQEVINSSP